MSRFWSDVAAGLTPYVPGEQPRGDRLVKLNTNENPYGPSPQVLAAIAGTSADELRRYPDPQSTALREAFAARAVVTVNATELAHDRPECVARMRVVFAHLERAAARQAAQNEDARVGRRDRRETRFSRLIRRQSPALRLCCGLIFAMVYVGLNMTADILAILANPRLRQPK